MLLPVDISSTTTMGSPTSPSHSAMHNYLHSFRNTFLMVDGIEYPLTREGIQQACDAVSAEGGGTVLLPPNIDIEFDGTTVTVPSGVCIKGSGFSTVLRPQSGAVDMNMFSVFGEATSYRPLNSNAAEGATSIVLTTGSIAALDVDIGDVIYIYDSATEFNLNTRIVAISTPPDTLALADPLPYAFPSATTQVSKIHGCTDVRIENMTLDASENEGTDTKGIFTQYAYNVQVENMYIRGFSAEGCRFYWGYNIYANNIELERCGNGGAADIWFIGCSKFQSNNVRSQYATGFACQFDYCSLGQYNNYYVSSPYGRANKAQFCRYIQGTNITCVGVQSNFTGIAINNTHKSLFANVICMGNGSGAGVWIADDNGNSSDNVFVGCISRSNSGPGLVVDSGCVRNRFYGCTFDTITDNSPSSWFDGRCRKVVSQDRTISSSTLADITDLEDFQLEAGKKYTFRAVLYKSSNATSVGVHHAINYSGSITILRLAEIINPVSAPTAGGSAVAFGYTESNNTKILATTNSMGSGGAAVLIEGEIEVSTAGTLAFRHASEDATQTTTKRGSWAEIVELQVA